MATATSLRTRPHRPAVASLGAAALAGSLAVAAIAAVPSPASAGGTAVAPAAASGRLATQIVASDLQDPVAVSSPRDGTGRLFVVERTGKVRIVRHAAGQAAGSVATSPYLDLAGKVTTAPGLGLVSIAFNPAWKTSPYAYVSYTRPDGNLQVTRYRPTGGRWDADTLDPSTATPVITIYHRNTGRTNHGGALAFGTQGYLYVTAGSTQGAAAAQDLRSLQGKVLRLQTACGTPPYCIPSTNPFKGNTRGYRPEIWLWGVHDPRRMSVDAANGDIWLNDLIYVGAAGDPGDEVNVRKQYATGANLGYDCSYEYRAPCLSGGERVAPRLRQGKLSGRVQEPNELIGGAIYRGGAYPSLRGHYIYAEHTRALGGDFEEDRLTVHNPGGVAESGVRSSLLARRPAGFGEADGRELYVVTRSGTLERLEVAPAA